MFKRKHKEVVTVYKCVKCGVEDKTIRPHPYNRMSEYCCDCLVGFIDVEWKGSTDEV